MSSAHADLGRVTPRAAPPAPTPARRIYQAVGLPTRWDGERPGVAGVPPLPGEHTGEVLAELGYENRTIEELARHHVTQL